jgi:hypothetical protein
MKFFKRNSEPTASVGESRPAHVPDVPISGYIRRATSAILPALIADQKAHQSLLASEARRKRDEDRAVAKMLGQIEE